MSLSKLDVASFLLTTLLHDAMLMLPSHITRLSDADFKHYALVVIAASNFLLSLIRDGPGGQTHYLSSWKHC